MDGSGNVVARHDYLPFGEEVWSGVGMRTTGQQFSAMDQNRMRYALTEKDEATGLDHTWWRKYENNSGRWTTPDPLAGSIADPQSLNRYSYVQNDPVNLVDPTGLEPALCLVDGMPTNCGAASNFVSSGAGVPGPLNRTRFDHRRGMFVHFTAIANATGWIPIGARYLGGLSWGWTDYSKWAAPSHTFTFTENRLSDLRYYAGSLEFHYGNGIQKGCLWSDSG